MMVRTPASAGDLAPYGALPHAAVQRSRDGQRKRALESLENDGGPLRRLAVEEASLRPRLAPAPSLPQVRALPRASEGLSQPAQIGRVAISGGGPVGLAAAILMRQLGVANVTVFEKRDGQQTPPVHFNVRPEFLPVLRMLGVYDTVFASAGAIEKITFIDDIRHRLSDRSPDELTCTVAQPTLRDVLEQPSVAQIRLEELRTALVAEAQRCEARLVLQAEVEIEESADTPDYYGVRLTASAAEAPSHRSDLIVVAEGANSKSRQALGISMRAETQKTYFISGVVPRRVGPQLIRRIAKNKNGVLLRQICVGHAAYEHAWVLVEVPPVKINMHRQDAIKFYTRHAAHLFKDSLVNPPVWGGHQIFSVQQQRAAAVTHGQNVVLIGDAARTGHFLTSGGINTALIFDLASLATLVKNLNAGTPRAEAFAAYADAVNDATDAWLAVGLREFYSTAPTNLGVSFFPQEAGELRAPTPDPADVPECAPDMSSAQPAQAESSHREPSDV